MTRTLKHWIAAAVLAALTCTTASAEPYAETTGKAADKHPGPLLQTTTTWAGEDIVYPQGKAEVTSLILAIAAGQTTPFHCHPVPTLGYILKGSVEIETIDGKKNVLHQGQSAVEVFKTMHRGRAINGPVEILVFYAGAVGIPNTVSEEQNRHSPLCR